MGSLANMIDVQGSEQEKNHHVFRVNCHYLSSDEWVRRLLIVYTSTVCTVLNHGSNSSLPWSWVYSPIIMPTSYRLRSKAFPLFSKAYGRQASTLQLS